MFKKLGRVVMQAYRSRTYEIERAAHALTRLGDAAHRIAETLERDTDMRLTLAGVHPDMAEEEDLSEHPFLEWAKGNQHLPDSAIQHARWAFMKVRGKARAGTVHDAVELMRERQIPWPIDAVVEL